MNGYISFLGTNVQFNFENDKLTVYCQNGEANSLLREEIASGVYSFVKKDIPFSRITGYSYDLKKEVIFYINCNGYGVSSGLLTDEAILNIQVLKYLTVENSVTSQQNTTISLCSMEFHKFLNLIPVYSLSGQVTDNFAFCNQDSSSIKNIAKIKYNNIEGRIYPVPIIGTKDLKLIYTPSLCIEMNEHLTEEDSLLLIETIKKSICFLFMRTNVSFDTIEFATSGRKYKLFDLRKNDIIEEEKYFNLLIMGKVMWGSIFESYNEVLSDFKNNLIYTEFLKDRTQKRMFVDFETVSKYSAFFESTYHLIYGDKIEHNPASTKINEEIIAHLELLRDGANRNKRKVLDYLEKQLDHIALSTKMERVFRDYKECLNLIRSELHLENIQNQEIAKKCSDIRNWTDHGDSKAYIDSEIASCFAFLLGSCYAMILRRWGLSDESISHQVLNLFKI